MSTIDVDFDFYSLRESDYHATKRFLSVLFGSVEDAERMPLIDVSESIVNQTQVGTVVKVDGEEGDPYGLLTLLMMQPVLIVLL
jgi:protein BCP1